MSSKSKYEYKWPRDYEWLLETVAESDGCIIDGEVIETETFNYPIDMRRHIVSRKPVTGTHYDCYLVRTSDKARVLYDRVHGRTPFPEAFISTSGLQAGEIPPLLVGDWYRATPTLCYPKNRVWPMLGLIIGVVGVSLGFALWYSFCFAFMCMMLVLGDD